MNLVFCCEDNFGLNVIKKLKNKNTNIKLVVCLYKNNYSHISIKNYCNNQNIKFILLKRNNSIILKKLFNNILKLNIDVIVSCHFNYIIPRSFLLIPKLGSINLHPSLLPLYRGQSPQHWPIINNDKKYGLTVHYMTDKVDQGNILYQKKILKPKNIYISELQNKLRKYYFSSIYRSLQLIKKGYGGKKQIKKIKSYKAKITSKDLKININESLRVALNKIRAFSRPYQGAKYKNLVIWSAKEINYKIKKRNGLYKSDSNKVYIIFKKKSLLLTDYNEI